MGNHGHLPELYEICKILGQQYDQWVEHLYYKH